MLTEGDDDWLAVVGNLGKARKILGRLSRILSREGGYPKVLGNFYKAVAHAVLVFRVDTWVINPQMERALENFQHRVSRRVTGKQLWRQADRSWEYPPLVEAMGEAGFEDTMKSITRRQNTVAQYIATRPILDLCERATRRPGVRVSWQWWEQAGIDLEGAKKRVAEAATVLELELELDSDSTWTRAERRSLV